jgi:hypothetical protein
MDALETYLRDVQAIASSGAGVAETSYYPALANLLNEIGRTVKPAVKCIINPHNTGAGIPDGGLYTPDQFRRGAAPPTVATVGPSRGVIEAKGIADDVLEAANGEQVTRYAEHYKQVLVTNFRSFVLVAADADGRIQPLERYNLADDAESFRRAILTPGKTAEEHGVRFSEFLKRVMLRPAPLAAPADVAWFLASYARDARDRIADANLDDLAGIRTTLEEVLGLKFEGDKGDHFFRSSLVQTLFYGVFSAWVLWAKSPRRDDERFEWQQTAWHLHVPMIRSLYDQIATPAHLRKLGIVEMLGWAEDALNRVDRKVFFSRFEEHHAVQYFYEPFLAAFDPELRKQLGVWFTPPEIVQYMVTRVHTVLREELGIADGLADERVVVLDPCTGTGSYLVETLRQIHATLSKRKGDVLAAQDVKKAAMTRVFGFEILPAPFVVAHLQLGLLLQNLGAPLLDENDERAGVYLTNALTGWDEPDGPQMALAIPEMEREREASAHVKRDEEVIVIIGNPPYSGFAGMAVKEERSLSTAYRKATRTRQPQGQGLNDLYVRFFRMAERRIVERTGRGIVCFISNYSWLDGLSFTAMRERYLDAFGEIWIDCLNGDKYKTGKLTPEGDPDPSIFSTEWNREGIQVGTAITLLARRGGDDGADRLRFRNLWGINKREELLATIDGNAERYEITHPDISLGYPFLPTGTASAYTSWPALPAVFPVSFPGVKTSRDDALVDIDRDRLLRRMEQYFDPKVSHQEMRRIAAGIMEDGPGYDAEETRNTLRRRGFLPANIVPYAYRPFDNRWLYWEPETKLLDRNRAEYFPQVFDGNLWLEARQKQPMADFDRGYVTKFMADNFGNGLSSFFPQFTRLAQDQQPLLGAASSDASPNLSPAGQTYCSKTGVSETAPFEHVVAILRSPAFAHENTGALRQDWPRIPLPAEAAALKISAALGRRVAALLDVDARVPGVAGGSIRDDLRLIGVLASPGALDLRVTAGWGHAGQGGVTMPGRGKLVQRPYTAPELAAVEAGAAALGLTSEQMLHCLGAETCDVYLNDTACWRNVPPRVWDYTIGGYQVIKKWLSYREHQLLGRALAPDEAEHVMNMARRIAALLLMAPELDANYGAVIANTYDWPSPAKHR